MRRRSIAACKLTFIAALALFFGSVTGAVATAPAPAGVEVKTTHYDLYIEGMDPAEAGTTVEKLYARLTRFFGAEPHQRLRVKVYAKTAGMMASLKADHVALASDFHAGGIYVHSNGIAYVTAGAEALGNPAGPLLHECTHQFHRQSLHASGIVPKSGFYVEGIAEHFARYVEDESHAGVGKLQITLLDVTTYARQDFEQRHHGSFLLLAADRGTPKSTADYGGAWGLVSFLRDVHPAEFNRWASRLESLVDPRDAFAEVFGNERDAALSGEYSQWLQSRTQTWYSAGGSWSTDNTTVDGHALGTTGLCLLRRKFNSFSATVTRANDKGGAAGIVFDYMGPAIDFGGIGEPGGRCVWVAASGEIWNEDFKNGKWSDPVILGNVADRHHFTISMERTHDETNIMVDGRMVIRELRREMGMCGLSVIRGDASFSAIRYSK